MSIKAIIFDLDGVITDTAKYHFQAWQKLASDLRISFNQIDYEAIKGVDRMASLDWILAKGALKKTDMEKEQLAEQKNEHYRSLIATMTSTDVLPGVKQLLTHLRQQKLLVGLASASKNASMVLAQLNLTHYFDYVADANRIKNGKPDPEIFLTVADALNISSNSCIGIEDAIAGVRAIKAAGMVAVGIGNAEYLYEANLVYPSLEQVNLKQMLSIERLVS